MTKTLLLIAVLLLFMTAGQAQKISGIVTDDKGHVLPFASILVKGTTRGTTANNEGQYFLNTEKGKQIIICQYVGYERQEKTISAGAEDISLNFELAQQ